MEARAADVLRRLGRSARLMTSTVARSGGAKGRNLSRFVSAPRLVAMAGQTVLKRVDGKEEVLPEFCR